MLFNVVSLHSFYKLSWARLSSAPAPTCLYSGSGPLNTMLVQREWCFLSDQAYFNWAKNYILTWYKSCFHKVMSYYNFASSQTTANSSMNAEVYWQWTGKEGWPGIAYREVAYRSHCAYHSGYNWSISSPIPTHNVDRTGLRLKVRWRERLRNGVSYFRKWTSLPTLLNQLSMVIVRYWFLSLIFSVYCAIMLSAFFNSSDSARLMAFKCQ